MSRNPECAMEDQRPTVNAARCDGCGACVEACPCGAVAIVEGRPAFRCGAYCHEHADCPALAGCCWPCEEACPTAAIACRFGIVAAD